MNTIKSLHRAKNSTLEALHSLRGVDNQDLLAKVTVAFTNCLNEYQAEYDRLLSEGKDEYDILIALRDN